jgi:hypothetical protein
MVRINWDVLLNDKFGNTTEDFAQGRISAKAASRVFAFSAAAGPFRELVRGRGTAKARTLAKGAITRRSKVA